MAKKRCEKNHLDFTCWFFKQRQGNKFLVNWHHEYISDELQKVIDGETENLVINIPPGSSKTEMAVINFIARGLAINPRARFMHLSSGDELALLNSQTARDLVSSEEYQQLWDLKIADDAKSKSRWNVIVDGKKAGGVYATSLGGQITGFRAGHMAPGFQGAIIIDDPLKPEDAFSEPKLNQANRRLLTTVKSRKANPKTPIIVIMQRISDKDPTAFIQNGNLPGKWTHIVIPALIDDAYVKILPKKYHAMIDLSERDDKGRFSYWPYKEPLQDLLAMERGDGADSTGSRISRHVFAGQYQQSPTAMGGNIIKSAWFPKVSVIPLLKYRLVYADTAQKTKERNDFSVFQCWGMGTDKKIYLLDQIRGKWEGPELKKQAIAFWAKHKSTESHSQLFWYKNGEFVLGSLRQLKVEDKASGTDLIQSVKLPPHSIPVIGIERNKDKLTRVMDAQPYLEAGFVCVPGEAPFTSSFLQECEAFTADDTHAFDDQIDPMVDAVMDMLSNGNKLAVWENLI